MLLKPVSQFQVLGMALQGPAEKLKCAQRSSRGMAQSDQAAEWNCGALRRVILKSRALQASWEPGWGNLDFLGNLDLYLWPRGWDERGEKSSLWFWVAVGLVVGGVESLRKIWVWVGCSDIEHEMVKLIQHIGVRSA